MKSEGSLDQQGMLTEEDQRSILIIGGIEILLPRNPVQVRACVADATIEEGKPLVVFIEEEEKEQALTFSPTEEEENST
jgi:hypothetical protein